MKQAVSKIVLCILATVSFASCRPTGFQIVDGKPAYVSWDEGNGTVVHELEGADAKTFERIPNAGRVEFAKDANRVFTATKYLLVEVEDADPSTFKVLGDGHYAKDAKHAYFDGAQIKGSDPASFQVLPFGYAKDSRHAYIGVSQIPADVASFEPLNAGLADTPWHDEGSGKNPNLRRRKTEEITSQGWSRDATSVFYGTRAMPNIDVKSFRALHRFYAKDDQNVFYADSVIAGADSQSFAIDLRALAAGGINIASGPDASDKNHTYRNGKVLK